MKKQVEVPEEAAAEGGDHQHEQAEEEEEEEDPETFMQTSNSTDWRNDTKDFQHYTIQNIFPFGTFQALYLHATNSIME